MIKYFFSLFVVSFFVGPRLFDGVRVDDFILFSYLVVLVSTGRQKINADYKGSVFSYFIFVAFTVVFLLYGKFCGVSGIEPFVYLFKYISYWSGMLIGYHFGASKYYSGRLISHLVLSLIAINSLWILYQMYTGIYHTALGESQANSYGIQLIGEGAAFQVGMMLAYSAVIILVFTLSENVVRRYRLLLLLWYFLLLYFVYLSQSRISLGVTLAGSLFLASRYVRYYKYVYVTSFLILCPILFLNMSHVAEFLDLSSRFSLDGLYSGFGVRINEIWGEVLHAIVDRPILGSGVGGLELISNDMVEVHNYYLKVLLEGGWVYFLSFMGFLLSAFFTIRNDKHLCVSNELKYIAYCVLIGVCLSGIVQDSFSSSKVVLPLMMLLGIILGLKKNEFISSGRKLSI